MNKLEITLKQHTPIIHFQHDQNGATLRASEVKPKLDRFILTRLGEGDYQKGLEKAKINKWLIDETKGALKYKMRIEASNLNKDFELSIVKNKNNNKHYTQLNNKNEDFPLLLNNLGGKENKADLMNLRFYTNNSIDILVIDNKLTQNLIDSLPEFFAKTNFGQRSTKGFGCFSVTQINKNGEKQNGIELSIYSLLDNGTPFFKFKLNDNYNDVVKLFKVIDFYWKLLKSGINYTKRTKNNENEKVCILHEDRYLKPYLYTYLKGFSKTWEKREIKNHFNQLKTVNPLQSVTPNNDEIIFARGLMGAPEFFEYKVPQGSFKEVTVKGRKKHVEDKKDYKVFIYNENIKRIPSPIYFKPYFNNDGTVSVYVLVDNTIIESIKQEKNKQFEFTCGAKVWNPNTRKHEYNIFQKNGKNDILIISIDANSINYLELIKSYHEFIGTDSQMSSIFQGMGLSKQKRQLCMVARDFHWNNILDNNDLISFDEIKK